MASVLLITLCWELNMMPGEWDWMGGGNTQDVSGIPADDATAQLLLKRRLAQADLLRGAEAPQGQMISGHYVGPSWTQYLANAVNKYQGGQQEREAMKQYGAYETAKSAKLGSLLEDLSKGKETKTYDNTPFQIQVPNGQTPTPTDNLGGMQPYESGMKTISVPNTTVTSTYQPYSQKEFMAKVGTVMPEMLPKFLESQFAQYAPKKPIELGAGAKLIDPNSYKVLAENPKEGADSKSTLEKEYDFMVQNGYKGSAQDYFDMKRSMTEKERQDFEIKLNQLGLDKFKLYYETGYGTPPGGNKDINKAALDWANANPNDPRAAQIKQKLGVK